MEAISIKISYINGWKEQGLINGCIQYEVPSVLCMIPARRAWLALPLSVNA